MVDRFKMENQTLFLIKMIRTTLLTFLVITFISCNTTDSGRPYKSDVKIFAKNPYIIGEITQIGFKRVGNDFLFQILVEENPGVYEPDEVAGNKIYLTLWNSTEIFTQKENGNIYFTNRESLEVGQKARAWLMGGTILTSYTAQAGAKQVLVYEE